MPFGLCLMMIYMLKLHLCCFGQHRNDVPFLVHSIRDCMVFMCLVAGDVSYDHFVIYSK